jgi:hypothetical protein
MKGGFFSMLGWMLRCRVRANLGVFRVTSRLGGASSFSQLGKVFERLGRIDIAGATPLEELTDVHAAFPDFRFMHKRLAAFEFPRQDPLRKCRLLTHLPQHGRDGSIAQHVLTFCHSGTMAVAAIDPTWKSTHNVAGRGDKEMQQ